MSQHSKSTQEPSAFLWEDFPGELASIKDALQQSALVLVIDADGTILYVNDKVCEVTGYSKQELLGQDASSLSWGYRPEYASSNKPIWDTLREGVPWHGEIVCPRKDGTLCWLNCNFMPLLGEDGKPIRFLAIHYNITERKHAEDELNNIKFALDQAAMVVISDTERNILYANPKFCQKLQINIKDLLGKHISICHSTQFPEKTFKQLNATIASGKIWKGEVIHQAKDGSEFWSDTTIVPFLNNEGKPFQYISIRYDITEQKRIEEELRLLNEQLEERVDERTQRLADTNKALQQALQDLQESENSKETFIAAMTHDLRTPLIAQQRVLDIFKRHQDSLPAELGTMAEGLLKSNHDVLELVNKLLEIHHYESGHVLPDKGEVELYPLIKECLTDLQTLAQQQNIQMHNHVSETMEPVYADLQMLKRVCMNLLGNALANIPAKSEIWISASDTPYASLIEISDNGPGIPEEFLPGLFDRFFHARQKHKQLGSGLGLSICKMIMELHNGSITVESKAGQGASFLLTFPKVSAS